MESRCLTIIQISSEEILIQMQRCEKLLILKISLTFFNQIILCFYIKSFATDITINR